MASFFEYLINPFVAAQSDAVSAAKPETPAPPANAAPNPLSKTVGGRTGIADYNGIGLPDYKDPFDVQGFKGSKYYGLATGDSMSPWSKLAAEQQNNLAAQRGAEAIPQAQGAAATTVSNLARAGGATSGAMERAQEQAGKNVLSMTQDANQAAGNNIANIGIEDAKQRMAMLGNATDKLNTMTSGNISGQNKYNENITNMLNQAVGSNRTALAAENAAKESNSGGISLLLLLSTSLMGSFTPKEAAAAEALNSASRFSRLKMAREVIGSEKNLRGYYKFSNAVTPYIKSNFAKKVVLYTVAKPLLKKGLVAKLWGAVFNVLGGIV